MDEVERWIEIGDDVGRLITVIELLRPTSKQESRERDRYDAKRPMFLGVGANLVEIDLVRQGTSVFPDRLRHSFRVHSGMGSVRWMTVPSHVARSVSGS